MVGGKKSVFYFAGIQATAYFNPSVAVNVFKIKAYFMSFFFFCLSFNEFEAAAMYVCVHTSHSLL